MLNMLHKMGHKLTRIFGEPNIGITGASKAKLNKSREIFSNYPLADVLPYEAYDEEREIFIGKSSLGFVIEAIPLCGSEDSIQKEISSFFDELLDEDFSIQCLLLADHRVDPFLNWWQKARMGGDEIFHEMAHKRAEFFKNPKQTTARNFRFILSYSIGLSDVKYSEKLISSLVEKREKFLRIFSFTYAFNWKVSHFLETVGGLINFTLKTDTQKRKWNAYQTLDSQLAMGGSLNWNKEGLSWENETNAAFKSFRVIDYPEQWSFGKMQLLIGDILRDNYRIPYPFYLHYGVHCPKQSKVENTFWQRSQLIEKQGRSYALLRMIPQLENELEECQFVRKAIAQNARFVWTQFSAGIWTSQDQISQAEQALKSIFRINQFNLVENKHIHLPQFLACLPMTWAEYVQDLKTLNVLKTTLTTECSNFVPMQGEWIGTASPGMLLIGRRGQLMNWNPFDNKSGNYNVVVVGRSGSGKSVFMQDLLLSGLGIGAKVYVIEVGRSFEKMCESVNGQSIHFSKKSPICLNPFSHIPNEDVEERDTSFSFLKSIIACMAAPTDGTTDYQNGLIEKAIRHAWDTKQNQATVTDVVEWLSTHEDQIARMLGIALVPYSKNGVYAKYFEGENNINFTNPMVLIELEELKEKKDLQAVVLQLFIMTITNQAFLGDRKTPFYICIDEAWDLLRAKQSGIFIETLARRLRKYFGSLVIGTQSIDDFFATPGAKAAFENSDWMCLLAQKKSHKLEMEEHKKRALETVTTRHGEYSEVMICDADGGYSIARLILDPFSQLLYSTKAQEYARLKELQREGMTISQAINQMLREREYAKL